MDGRGKGGRVVYIAPPKEGSGVAREEEGSAIIGGLRDTID